MMMQAGGLTEFLRRIVIVMVEDVCAQPWLPYVVYYMVLVSKGVQLTREVVHRLLCCAWLLAEERDVSDTVPDDDHCARLEPNAALWCSLAHKQDHLPARKKDLLLAFGLRIAYGGMKGDMQMMHGTIEKISRVGRSDLWEASDQTSNPFSPSFASCIPDHIAASMWLGLSGDDGERHRLPSAVDFHCSDIIAHMQAEWMQVQHKQQQPSKPLDYFYLKRCIWQHRSSPNVRQSLSRKKLRSTVRTPLVPTASGVSTPPNWPLLLGMMDAYSKKEWLRPAASPTAASSASAAAATPVATKKRKRLVPDSSSSSSSSSPSSLSFFPRTQPRERQVIVID
jgi:hypothetical protein